MIRFQTILFTMDEDILELVAQNDQAFEIDSSQDLGSLESIDERPATADGENNEVCYLIKNFALPPFSIASNVVLAMVRLLKLVTDVYPTLHR